MTEVAAEQDANQWAMWLHLSILMGFVIPLAGLAIPIILWQKKKQELPSLDEHGKIAVNWVLSAFIYGLVAGVLTLVLVGYLFLFALAICGVIFPIIAGIKANSGEVWRYPLSIRFFT